MRLQCSQLGKVFGVAILLAWTAALAPTRAAFINLTPTTGSNSDTSVLLSQLLGPTPQFDGITVGDKNMSGFSYSIVLPNGDMPQANQVNVLGYKDPFGNWGLTFQGTFHDDPIGGPSDALIRYTVAIDPAFVQQGYRITDAHLFVNGVGVGSPNSEFWVDESFAPDASDSSETLHAGLSTFPGAQPLLLADSTNFIVPHTVLHVTKDIYANAATGSGQSARATAIDQSFSQTIIPEPTSLVLLLVGLIGLIGYRRNR